MENQQTVGPLPTPKSSFMRSLHKLYYVHLDQMEWGIVALLLAAVLILSLIEILSRNLGWHPWDMGANQRAVYGFTFYLGVFGAVLASRKGKHIAIDVASPYLAPRMKMRLSVLLFLVGALACSGLAYSVHTFVVEVVDPDAYLVPNQIGSAWWKEQYWRWPMAPAFGLMAFHFLIGAWERVVLLQSAPEGKEEQS
jgi:TRAP-type C4-dicarboxylate transport system permease small subunit